MAASMKTLPELFSFYHNYVKLLYGMVESENLVPIETLFELNAAFDHVSRRWIYDEDESRVVDRAYGHLKRCCLDIFKIKYKLVIDHYNELIQLDLSLIDNGDFEGRLRELIAGMKKEATEARRLEGQTRHEDDRTDKCFDLWQPIFNKCLLFELDYYGHKKIDWARKKSQQIERTVTWRQFRLGVFASIFGGIVLGGWGTVTNIFVQIYQFVISHAVPK
jgi:hypothetical protein